MKSNVLQVYAIHNRLIDAQAQMESEDVCAFAAPVIWGNMLNYVEWINMCIDNI